MKKLSLATLLFAAANPVVAQQQVTPVEKRSLPSSARLQFWVIGTRKAIEGEIPQAAMNGHIENQVRLEKEGIMFAAGPVLTEGEPFMGWIVVRAANREEAKKIADSDPLHRSGMRTYKLRQWSINEGRFMVQIDYSDSLVKIR